MHASSEFMNGLHQTVVPDKTQIMRNRELVAEMTRRIEDPALASHFMRLLNDCYLNFQLSVIADDAELKSKCHSDCAALVDEIERAAGSKQAAAIHDPVGPAPLAQKPKGPKSPAVY